MAKIIAKGKPVKYPKFGEIKIVVEGGLVDIESSKVNKSAVEAVFRKDIKDGPQYPLCADPNTMRSALFVLFEWFGEERTCWVEEPEHVKLEGEIEPMESDPGVIY